MAEQLERFDESARQAFAFAEEEAQRLNHNYIGTEHILLGLLRDGGTANRIFRGLRIDLEETRDAVEYLVSRGSTPVADPIGLTPRAKQVLDLAVEYARSQQQELASTQHILLALLRARDDRPPGRGIAAGILESFGVTDEQVEGESARVLAEDESLHDHPFPLARAGKWDEAKQSLAKWREDRRRQGRRYSLVLPADLFEEVEQLAERQQTTVVDLLRRFTRLGLLAVQLQERRDAALIIREGGTDRQVMLL